MLSTQLFIYNVRKLKVWFQ